MNTHYFYINKIEDTSAIKFGITEDPSIRLNQQNKKNDFQSTPQALFCGSKELCEQAESFIKRVMPTCFLGRGSFPDGHTETSHEKYYNDIVDHAEYFLQREENYEYLYGQQLKDHLAKVRIIKKIRQNKK